MPQADKQSNYNFIDLFAGAGGLSEGFIQAGFRPVAHVEMNEYASKTLETRSAYYYLKTQGSFLFTSNTSLEKSTARNS